MKNVQIPYQLFWLLLCYHLMEDDSCAQNIRIGLEKKLDALMGLADSDTIISAIGNTGSGNRKAGTTTPSVGRNSSRQGAKAAFDGRNGCQKCFCVTFGKVTKLCAVSGADSMKERGEAY